MSLGSQGNSLFLQPAQGSWRFRALRVHFFTSELSPSSPLVPAMISLLAPLGVVETILYLELGNPSSSPGSPTNQTDQLSN